MHIDALRSSIVLAAFALFAAGCSNDDDDAFFQATGQSILIEEERNWTSDQSAYDWNNTSGGVARVSLGINDFNHGDLLVRVFDSQGDLVYSQAFVSSDWVYYIDGQFICYDFTDSGRTGIWTILLDFDEFEGEMTLLLEDLDSTDPDVPDPDENSALLDTAFGDDGRAIYAPDSSSGKTVAVDSTGRIVVCGTIADASDGSRHLAVWRYNTAGDLDAAFSGNGSFELDVSGYDNTAGFDVAIDSGNRPVACGWAQDSNGRTDLVLIRLTAAGALDSTFNTDGIAIIDQGEDEIGTGVAIDSFGRVLVGGSTLDDATTNGDALVARYTTLGVLDASFGTAGIATTGDASDRGLDLALDLTDRPILLGVRDEDFAMWKFDSSGDPEGSFGIGGLVTDAGAANEFRIGRSLIVHTDDTIAVAGFRHFEDGTDPTDLLAWRFESDGDPLTAFNGTGVVVYGHPHGLAAGASIVVDATGDVVVAGTTKSSGTVDASATCWRYNSNGTLDTTLPGSNATGVARFDERDNNSGTRASSITISGGGLTYVTGSAFDRDTGALEFILWKLDP